MGHAALLFVVSAALLSVSAIAGAKAPQPINPVANRTRQHLDHSPFFKKNPVKTPQEVTRACIGCHPNAAKEVMKTAHWTWISGDAKRDGK